MIEIKPDVKKKKEFERRDKRKMGRFSENSNNQNSDARNKIKLFSIQLPLPFKCCSIDTSLQETKPEVTEKHQFDYRDESRLIAILGTFEFF